MGKIFNRGAGASLPRGIWRTEVAVRIGELRNRVRIASCMPPRSGLTPCEHDRLTEAVDRCLDRAQTAIEQDRRRREHMRSWWAGTSMTTGWESIHEAELHLLSLEDVEDAKTTLPWLLTWVRRAMNRGPEKARHEKNLASQIDGRKLDRTQARQALRDVIVANNARYANLRAFRNNLVVVTALLAGLVAALCAWHALNPSILSLCSSGGTEPSCLAGTTSRPADVALVALVGALGGMLAIAFGLAKTKSPPSRYDPRAWLGLLKPVAGAATALIAVALIQADILLGPDGEHSEMLLLSYAAIFGFSQQLLTQFVDKRAESLIEADGASGSGAGDAEPS
ncbi:MAG TPA: hypothetical protein VIT89_00285 [Solirubrobacterales bacterium]